MDGILYLSACPTRYGEFPYCRYMRHGAFSVTKSAAAALALLRLAQKFGPGVFDERIDVHLNVTSAHSGWAGVTFRDALNMATGIGDLSPGSESQDIFADENQPKMGRFVEKRSAAEKLAVAFSYQNYSWGPAEKLRYNSTHTFVLAAAMDAYLKSREGTEASIDDMLMNEVYGPIGINVLPLSTTIEAEGTDGIPLLYVGLYPTIEDMARIADLLQTEGTYDGQQILHRDSTAAALYRRSENGLLAGWWTNDVGENRYLLSFWSWPMREANGCRVEIPTMSGFGGNIVSLLPNGVSVFRFADAHYYEPAPLVDVARQLAPSC
jgi:CubicO group peptidase (beta-lactamase class C family)